MSRRIAIVSIILSLNMLMYGCWDMVDIDKRLFVASMGIDMDKDNFAITLTAPATISTGEKGVGKSGQSTLSYYREESDTIFGALDKLALRINRTLDFSHTSVMVIGEDTAKKGLGPILEYLERFTMVNRRSEILVCEGPAGDIHKLNTELEKQSSVYLDTIFENRNTRGYFIHTDVNEFISLMHSTNGTTLLSKAKIGSNDAYIGGAAVIKNYKFIGWLNPSDTIGINFIKGNTSEAIIPYKDISFEISKSRSKMKLISAGEIPTIRIDINIECNILEAPYLAEINEEKIKILENSISARIESIVSQSLQTLQSTYNCDVIGINEYLYKFHPDIWEKYQKNWDEIFPNIKFEVNVKSTVGKIGGIK